MFYTRLSVHRGGSLDRDSPDRDPQTETPRQRPPLERDPQKETPWRGTPRQTPPLDRDPQTETLAGQRPQDRETSPGQNPQELTPTAVTEAGGAHSTAGADPGAPTYKFARFSQKLHEIKKILVHSGVRAGGAPPLLDPPLYWNAYLLILISLL